MDLQQPIKVNRQIMKLIESKYGDLFPAAYNNPDARYYRMLDRDTQTATVALSHDGITINVDEGK